jgi:tetratricopeptide (TPR) repeat protein
VLFKSGKTQQAIDEYELGARLQPDATSIHGNLGAALRAAGRTDEGIAEEREAIRLAGDNASAHNDLAIMLEAKGQGAEAAEEYQRALKFNPDLEVAHSNLGSLLASSGKLEEAIEQEKEALRIKPDFPEAELRLGIFVAALGRTDEAIALDRAAIAMSPRFAEAHYNLAVQLEKTPAYATEALAEFEKAASLNPSYVEALVEAGNLLFGQGRLSDAIDHYRSAERLMPESATIHTNLALTFMKMPGKTAEAKEELEALLKIQPDNRGARQALEGLKAAKE